MLLKHYCDAEFWEHVGALRAYNDVKMILIDIEKMKGNKLPTIHEHLKERIQTLIGLDPRIRGEESKKEIGEKFNE